MLSNVGIKSPLWNPIHSEKKNDECQVVSLLFSAADNPAYWELSFKTNFLIILKQQPPSHHSSKNTFASLVLVVAGVSAAMVRLGKELQLAVKLDAEVAYILFVQRVCQGQVGRQSPRQQEPV